MLTKPLKHGRGSVSKLDIKKGSTYQKDQKQLLYTSITALFNFHALLDVLLRVGNNAELEIKTETNC